MSTATTQPVMTENLENCTVAVLVADMFEDLELWYPVIRLREAGVRVTLIGTQPGHYRGKHGLGAEADAGVSSLSAGEIDGLVIPGGYAPDKLRRSKPILELVKTVDQLGKPLAMICHAGWVPASAGILRNRHVTSYPSIKDDLENAGAYWEDNEVVVDGNLISSRSPDDLPAFCRTLLSLLATQSA